MITTQKSPMKIIKETFQLAGSAVALGSFDGVHKGHQVILKETVKQACKLKVPSVALCLMPPKTEQLIEDEYLRRKHIKELGIDHCFQLEFLDYYTISADDFIDKILHLRLGCKLVTCGTDFRFGHKRQGNLEILINKGDSYGFCVNTPKRCDKDGEKISSTRIRTALKDGDIERANSMLGRAYCINNVVKHGFGIGSKLGFPTINQYWEDGFVIPKNGVYITTASIDTNVYPSATGVTARPSFTEDGAVSCETTIAAKVDDLYGQHVLLSFHEYLFEPKKFDDLSDLTNMVLSACEQSKKYFTHTLKTKRY